MTGVFQLVTGGHIFKLHIQNKKKSYDSGVQLVTGGHIFKLHIQTL